MKNSHMMIALLAFSFLVPTLGHARRGKGPFSPKNIERAAEKLGIDAGVVSKIKALVYEGRRGAVKLRAELETAKIDLHEQMSKDDPDRAAVMTAIDRAGQLKIKLRKHRTGVMLSIRALLTPEQRRGLRSLMKHRRQHRRHKRGKRGKRGHRDKRPETSGW